MKLRFYARDDQLEPYPFLAPSIGQPRRYVGRKFLPAVINKGEVVEPANNPAVKDAAEFDSNSQEGKRLAEVVRRDHSLWAADEGTAAFCGVPFVRVRFDEGVWIEGTDETMLAVSNREDAGALPERPTKAR